MEGFITFLALVWSVLCIVLFFKVWGMCNNVSKMLSIMEQKNGFVEDVSQCIPQDFNLHVGDKVFIKSKGKESVVVDIIDGQYECSSNNKNFYDGVFERNDLIKR